MIIRKLRLQRGWSQEQLAEVSGVSVRTIQRIEQGKRASLESLKCLAAVFETPIPDLQKEHDMSTPETYTLTEEDQAALKYAHFLKSYDTANGDALKPANNHAQTSLQEQQVIRQVREMRHFYSAAIFYVAVVLFLLIVNLMSGAEYLWVVWPALGMGMALALFAIRVFGNFGAYGDDWERRKVEERLQKL